MGLMVLPRKWSIISVVQVYLIVIHIANGCPTDCKCMKENGHYNIQCEDVNVKNILADIPEDTYRLKLLQTKIQNLNSKTFGMTRFYKVRELIINNCNMETISNDALKQFPNLNRLDISQNAIREVSPEAFVGLSQLVSIDFSENDLKVIEQKALETVRSSLREVSLSKNPLRKIDLSIFSKFYKLDKLSLSQCSLTDVKLDALQNNGKLKYIDISKNKLTNISHNNLRIFEQLNEVAISGNSWHCDCKILPLRNWLENEPNVKKLVCSAGVSSCSLQMKCQSPHIHKDKDILLVNDNELRDCGANDTNEEKSSLIVLVVSIVLVVVTILIIVGFLIYTRYKKRHKGCTSENGSCRTFDINGGFKLNGGFDVGSINGSDRTFALRNYMQTIEELSGPFSSINTGSNYTRPSDTVSMSTTSHMTQYSYTRESAV